MKRWFVVIAAISLLLPMVCGAAFAVPQQAGREEEIRAAVQSYVQEKIANLGWESHIKRITVTSKATLPNGALDYEVVAPQQWEGWGNVNLTVYVRQNERMVGNVSLRVEVESLADMVVAVRPLDSGTLISAGDIVLQRREVASVNGRFVKNREEVIGKRARVTLKANQPLRLEQLEKVPLIKSGQMVTIVAENDVMKISVAGKARGNGAEGDIIMVLNLNSLKEIPARVINASTVQVGF